MKKIFHMGMYYFNRKILDLRARELISNCIKNFLPKVNGYDNTKEGMEWANKLEDDGVIFLPKLLSPLQIKQIIEFFKDKSMFQSYDRDKTLYTADKIPQGTHVASYLKDDVLNCPHLLEVANHPLILDIVSKVMNCKPTISNINVWRSYPGFDVAKDSENFHRDVDDFHFLKLFIYLTDVDEQSGPHVYVKKSHKSKDFLRIARFTDEEIYNKYHEKNILKITGEAGSTILENTFGLHKGQVAESKERMIFQVEYSLLPIGAYKYKPIKKHDVSSYDRYINRLFIK